MAKLAHFSADLDLSWLFVHQIGLCFANCDCFDQFRVGFKFGSLDFVVSANLLVSARVGIGSANSGLDSSKCCKLVAFERFLSVDGLVSLEPLLVGHIPCGPTSWPSEFMIWGKQQIHNSPTHLGVRPKFVVVRPTAARSSVAGKHLHVAGQKLVALRQSGIADLFIRLWLRNSRFSPKLFFGRPVFDFHPTPGSGPSNYMF